MLFSSSVAFYKAFLQVNCFLIEVIFNLEKLQKSERPHLDSKQDIEQVACLFLKKKFNYKGGTTKSHRHCETENFSVPYVWPFSQHCMTNVGANIQ